METRPDLAFCLFTFGCKVNQYETQSVREAWLAGGGRETDDPALADVVLLNTCAVTANAVADARQAVRRLSRVAPRARVVIAGCASEAAKGEFLALPGVALVLSQDHKSDLLDARRVWARIQGGEEPAAGPLPSAVPGARAYPPFSIRGFRRARPVLKVQDGCTQGCAYCIVPLTRGPSRSRPPADCVAEARRLLEAGYREIMLSGINLRQYRAPDRGCADFWDLLRRLDRELAPEWAAEARFRVSSVDPAQLDERGLDCLGQAAMICPHLHLSLQSGSPAVLRAMRRAPCTPDRVLDAVAAFRRLAGGMSASAAQGRVGLGADILMGFPGESEAQAEETLALVRALPLTYAHVFPFSSRPGTPAADLPDQVPHPLRQERAARVRAVAEAKRRDFWQDSLALPALRVAPDGDGSSKGVDECYVPCRFSAPFPESGENSRALILARPVEATEAGLRVEPLARG